MIKLSLKKVGIGEMQKALEPGLHVRLAKSTARREFARFASETKGKLRAATPVLKGDLKRATKSKSMAGGGAKVYISRDGSRSGKGYHSHLVEKGTKKRHTKKGANRGTMPAAKYQEPILQAAAHEFDATIVPRLASAVRKSIADAIRKGKLS